MALVAEHTRTFIKSVYGGHETRASFDIKHVKNQRANFYTVEVEVRGIASGDPHMNWGGASVVSRPEDEHTNEETLTDEGLTNLLEEKYTT